MTVRELKKFIENCNDDDFVTICSCRDDNPVKDYCDVGVVYKIAVSNDNLNQICLMPM